MATKLSMCCQPCYQHVASNRGGNVASFRFHPLLIGGEWKQHVAGNYGRIGGAGIRPPKGPLIFPDFTSRRLARPSYPFAASLLTSGDKIPSDTFKMHK